MTNIDDKITTKQRLLFLKQLIDDMEAHRQKAEGEKGVICNDERVFCPYEKQELLKLLKSIVIQLNKIEEKIGGN